MSRAVRRQCGELGAIMLLVEDGVGWVTPVPGAIVLPADIPRGPDMPDVLPDGPDIPDMPERIMGWFPAPWFIIPGARMPLEEFGVEAPICPLATLPTGLPAPCANAGVARQPASDAARANRIVERRIIAFSPEK